MSKILKVYHPKGKVASTLLKDIANEIETITHYNDKIEISFKNSTSINIRKK